jgi:hypothetical protein
MLASTAIARIRRMSRPIMASPIPCDRPAAG